MYEHGLCLLFSQILISANRDVPAFSEAGTLFYTPMEKDVLAMMQRTDFKNLSKGDVADYRMQAARQWPQSAA